MFHFFLIDVRALPYLFNLFVIHIPYILFYFKLTELEYSEHRFYGEELESILNEFNYIFRIGGQTKSISEKLQLLIMKLIILLWEEKEEEDLEKMEEKLRLIDDIRHELSFLRAKYYKELFNKKFDIKF